VWEELSDEAADRAPVPNGTAQIPPKQSRKIVHVLLPKRAVQAELMAKRGELFAGSAPLGDQQRRVRRENVQHDEDKRIDP
jgi:hypothetical protein